MSDLRKLAVTLEKAETSEQLKFSVCQGKGWTTSSSESTTRLLCDMWNNRKEIAIALKMLEELKERNGH